MSRNHITYVVWNGTGFFVFWIVYLVLDMIFAEVHIPQQQILAISILFGLYYWLLFVAWWLVFDTARTSRWIGLALMILSALVLAVGAYPLFYEWLPRYGIVFHHPAKEFDVMELWERLLTGFLFVVLMSGLSARFFRTRAGRAEKQKQLADLRAEVAVLGAKVEAKHLSPHLIQSVIMTTLHEVDRQRDSQRLDTLLLLSEVMHYAIRMYETDAVADLDQEWTQVQNLAQLGDIALGKGAVVVSPPAPDLPKTAVPMGTLITPVENALKYASGTESAPILIQWEETAEVWTLMVTNSFCETKRQRVKSGQTGYLLLQRRLQQGSWPIHVICCEDKDRYLTKIIGRKERC